MTRIRIALVMLALLAALQFAAACSARDFVGGNPKQDAANGAAVGFTIGGPQGAAIGSALMLVLGVIVRHAEKRKLRRSGELTDKTARREAITAKVHRKPTAPQPHPAENPSGLYPQQSIPLTSEIDNGH